jgi:hypothetical protein
MESSVLVQTYNPSTVEPEAKGLAAQGHLGIHSKTLSQKQARARPGGAQL